jgi:hypothetical protein
MASASSQPPRSATLGLRSAAREYDFARETIKDKILPNIPHRWVSPRRVVFMREDFEAWIRGASVRPSAHAEDVVSERLEHENAVLKRVAAQVQREGRPDSP